MGIEEFDPLLAAVPFDPFTLTLSDGSSYDIDRPEQIRLSPRGRALYLKRPDGRRAILALAHVVSIAFPDTPIVRGCSMTGDEAFIRAILDSPGDEGPRLVYADWLEERSDPRAPYLRAEHAWTKCRPRQKSAALQKLRTLAKPLDAVWVARVSRPPVGVCVEAPLFRSAKKPATEKAIQSLTSAFKVVFPVAYHAFLLNYNGGGFLWPPFTEGGKVDEELFGTFFCGVGLVKEFFPNLATFAAAVFQGGGGVNRRSGLFPIGGPESEHAVYLLAVGSTRSGTSAYFGRVYVTEEPSQPWSRDANGDGVPEGLNRHPAAASFPALLAAVTENYAY